MSRLARDSASGNPGGGDFSEVSGGSVVNPDASGPLAGGHLRNTWQSRSGDTRPRRHWEPSLGSPGALISMCVKVGLEGRYTLLTGAVGGLVVTWGPVTITPEDGLSVGK